jgi:hypothetical protein
VLLNSAPLIFYTLGGDSVNYAIEVLREAIKVCGCLFGIADWIRLRYSTIGLYEMDVDNLACELIPSLFY